MESTLVDSSPLSKNNKCNRSLESAQKLLVEDKLAIKDELRRLLNPTIRLMRDNNIRFALPMSWYDHLDRVTHSSRAPISEKHKYQDLMNEMSDELFPCIELNRPTVNIHTKNISDTKTGLETWFEYYQLPLHLQNIRSKRLNTIQNTILKHLRHAGLVSFPFTLVVSYSLMSIPKVRLIRDKLAAKVGERDPAAKLPLFTIHLQDENQPFVILWMDTENVCSFNIGALSTPSAYANFANTLVMFINYSLPETRHARL